MHARSSKLGACITWPLLRTTGFVELIARSSQLTRSGQTDAADASPPKARKMTLMDGNHANALPLRAPDPGKREEPNERASSAERNRWAQLVRGPATNFTQCRRAIHLPRGRRGADNTVYSQKVTLRRRDRATV
jgi:hypothetical protein